MEDLFIKAHAYEASQFHVHLSMYNVMRDVYSLNTSVQKLIEKKICNKRMFLSKLFNTPLPE